jgi:hypothetical protein
LEWNQPETQQADWLLKALLAELKERNAQSQIFLNLDWVALLNPDTITPLADQVNGICLTGLDSWPQNLEPSGHELLRTAFVGSLGRWIFQTSLEVETGWTLLTQSYESEALIKAGSTLALQDINGINWLSLTDPLTKLHSEPPWNLNPALANLGLLDQALEPKTEWGAWFKEWSSQKVRQNLFDFIDISLKEYLSDPQIHLNRLWGHFIDSY